MKVDLDAPATQSAFAAIAGVTQPVISQLMTRGVLPEGATLGRWILAYYAHLREIAAGRIAAHDAGLTAARTAHSRAAAERIELQNAVTRRELAPASLMEEVLARCAARIAGIFEGIPGAVQRRVPELPMTALKFIEEEIVRVRNTVASMSLADIAPEVGSIANEDDTKEAADAPEDDGRSVTGECPSGSGSNDGQI